MTQTRLQGSESQPTLLRVKGWGGGGKNGQKTDPKWTYIRSQSEFRPTQPHSWLEVPSALWYPLSSTAERSNTGHSPGLCPAHQGKASQRYTWSKNISSIAITLSMEVWCWSLVLCYELLSSISTLHLVHCFNRQSKVRNFIWQCFWYGSEMTGTAWCLPLHYRGKIYHVNRPHQHSSVSHKSILPQFPS